MNIFKFVFKILLYLPTQNSENMNRYFGTDFGNKPIDFAALAAMIPEYKCKHNKISSLEKHGDLMRLKKGLYLPYFTYRGRQLSENMIANHLYGPSYISLQSALWHYGLIPERVFTVCSMTTKRSRVFATPLARYEYVHINKEAFAIGIRETLTENGIPYKIASPEKALCDLISDTPYLNLRYKNEILTWLEEDLRFDMDELSRFDINILREYSKVGKKKNMIKQLIKIIES